MSDQVSHPHKTTDKSRVLYILNCIFLDRKLVDKTLYTGWPIYSSNFYAYFSRLYCVLHVSSRLMWIFFTFGVWQKLWSFSVQEGAKHLVWGCKSRHFKANDCFIWTEWTAADCCELLFPKTQYYIKTGLEECHSKHVGSKWSRNRLDTDPWITERDGEEGAVI